MRHIKPPEAREEKPFNADSVTHGGYLYTTDQSLSSKIAIFRQTREILSAYDFSGKSIIDIGCGDAGITIDLYDRTAPLRIEGIDPAANAIEIGKRRLESRNIRLSVASAYDLPFANDEFDVAHLRGVLHHMDEPQLAVREAARVARNVVVLEPNGYNPVLKAIEKLSAYHRSHGERSFFSGTINKWMIDAGLSISYRSFCCLVPYFCPDVMARTLKAIEPIVEAIPGIRVLACGAYVVVGRKHNG
jgi:ubiquinone/menaquinone biosynthesis C-methylase UbiE